MQFTKASILSLFTIASVVTAKPAGHRLRGLKEKGDELAAASAKLLAEIDLDNGGKVKYFEDSEGNIVSVGSGPKEDEATARAQADTKALDPVQSYERLSGQKAPDELVEAVTRINATKKEDPSTPEKVKDGDDRRLNSCDEFTYITGDQYYTSYTTDMYAEVDPYRGCVGVAIDVAQSGSWIFTGASDYVCSGSYTWVEAWGIYANYRARSYNAYGDGYHFVICTE
jgi:hypothetical protein